MAVGRNPSGSQNTEGYGAPFRSAWGQALIGGIPELIDQPIPIGNFRRSVKGNIGGYSTTSASVQALAALSDYYGDLPQSEQMTVDAPPPWERT